MGIQGLLPFLEKATRPCHISEFRGGTVTVDSYCLLHKGANSCAEQLARGQDNQMYVQYCLKYVKMMLSYDIHPIMVFDGRNLPAKAETEVKRRESRKKAKQRAAELLKLGKTDEAKTYLKQCIDITPKMAHNLIVECRKLNVDCIVAPYESDAQLAFFNIKGVAECVITEDSDLVLFGCKKVLYKLDLAGAGRLVEIEKIYLAMKMRPDQFTFDKFRFMCILSGCDYVSSLNGIGLKKAEKFLTLTAETNPEVFIDKLPRYLNMRHLVITDEYKRNVMIANATFMHQIIFDPYKKKLMHLLDPEMMGTNPEYLINAGDKFDNKKAYQVALGNFNPYTFEQHDNWNPSNLPLSQYSIWSGICKKRVSRKLEQEVQKTSFRKFITTGSIAGTLNEIKEQNLIQEDLQIERELSIYTRKLKVKEDSVHAMTEAVLEEKKDTQQSPEIPKNPFLKKKKLSKFPTTYTLGNTIVRSRFFFSESSISVNNITAESELTESYTSKEFVKENAYFSEKINNNLQTKSEQSSIHMSTQDILKSCENTETDSIEVITKKRSFEEIIQENEESENKEIKIEINNLEERIEPLPRVMKEQSDLKRRKLGPCRTLGLKKKPERQQTLHNFFNAFKNS